MENPLSGTGEVPLADPSASQVASEEKKNQAKTKSMVHTMYHWYEDAL